MEGNVGNERKRIIIISLFLMGTIPAISLAILIVICVLDRKYIIEPQISDFLMFWLLISPIFLWSSVIAAFIFRLKSRSELALILAAIAFTILILLLILSLFTGHATPS